MTSVTGFRHAIEVRRLHAVELARLDEVVRAERNLDQDDSGERIQNPAIEALFSDFDGVRYTSRARSN